MCSSSPVPVETTPPSNSGRQWRQRLQDREPSRFFHEAAWAWHQVATPRLTLSFGTERFRAELRRARTEAADLALEQDQRATVVALRQVKPTTRPWRHTMLGRRRSCQVAAQLRMDVAPLAPRLRHFTEVPTAECTNCGAPGRGPPETREHYLLQCPRWAPQRARLTQELTRYGVQTPPTLEVLLGGGQGSAGAKLAVARALHRYIAETGRFRDSRLRADAAPFVPANGADGVIEAGRDLQVDGNSDNDGPELHDRNT